MEFIVPAVATGQHISSTGSTASGHRWSVAVLASLVGGFAALGLILPIAIEAPIVDEPIYAISAYEWARTGLLEISGLSAGNAVFDTIWGGLFVRGLGETYNVLRLSSIVLTAISGPFMYWLARELGARRSAALVATAAYLFSPLVIVLSATFMTDAHFTALMVIALPFYVRGLKAMPPIATSLFAGSCFAALAFLSRPQALVIPVAAAIVIAWRTRGRGAIGSIIAGAGLPAATFAIHTIWTSVVGEPFIRAMYRQILTDRALVDGGPLAAKLLVMASVYVGLFVLPIVPLLDSGRATEKRIDVFRIGLAVGLVVVLTGMVLSGYDPTERQTWLTPNGLGAVERAHLGHRPPLWPGWVQGMLGLVAITGTYLWSDKVVLGRRRLVAPAGSFLALVGLGIIASALAASVGFHAEVFDRYWLPVVPILLAAAAAHVVPSKLRLISASALVGGLGMFGIIGTHDALVSHDAVAEFADDSVTSLAVDPFAFEGGAAWSAMTFGVADDGPEHVLLRPGPFWVKFYAVETVPEYGVALEALDGYEVLASREFPSILHITPTRVYLVKGDPKIGYFIDADDF